MRIFKFLLSLWNDGNVHATSIDSTIMNIRQDILGRTPEIGDTIAFNPPRISGLRWGVVIKFRPSGLPLLKCDQPVTWHGNVYAPVTGFVIIKRKDDPEN